MEEEEEAWKKDSAASLMGQERCRTGQSWVSDPTCALSPKPRAVNNPAPGWRCAACQESNSLSQPGARTPIPERGTGEICLQTPFINTPIPSHPHPWTEMFVCPALCFQRYLGQEGHSAGCHSFPAWMPPHLFQTEACPRIKIPIYCRHPKNPAVTTEPRALTAPHTQRGPAKLRMWLSKPSWWGFRHHKLKKTTWNGDLSWI